MRGTSQGDELAPSLAFFVEMQSAGEQILGPRIKPSVARYFNEHLGNDLEKDPKKIGTQH